MQEYTSRMESRTDIILYIDTALSYFLKIVFRLLAEQRVILLHYKYSGGLSFV